MFRGIIGQSQDFGVRTGVHRELHLARLHGDVFDRRMLTRGTDIVYTKQDQDIIASSLSSPTAST